MEIVARHSPDGWQIGEAMQATEKSDSLIWIDRRSRRAFAEASESASGFVLARPVGDTFEACLKVSSRSLSGRCPRRRRPEAVQFRGTREPIFDVIRKCPGPSAMAITTIWSPSRPQI